MGKGQKKQRLESSEAQQNVPAERRLRACFDVKTLGRAQPGPLEAGLGVGGASFVRCKHSARVLGDMLLAANKERRERKKMANTAEFVDFVARKHSKTSQLREVVCTCPRHKPRQGSGGSSGEESGFRRSQFSQMQAQGGCVFFAGAVTWASTSAENSNGQQLGK